MFDLDPSWLQEVSYSYGRKLQMKKFETNEFFNQMKKGMTRGGYILS